MATVTLGPHGTAIETDVERAARGDPRFRRRPLRSASVWTVDDFAARRHRATHTYTVVSGDTLAAIAGSSPRASTPTPPTCSGDQRRTDGAVLVIVNRDGTPFATALACATAGTRRRRTIDRSTSIEAAVDLAALRGEKSGAGLLGDRADDSDCPLLPGRRPRQPPDIAAGLASVSHAVVNADADYTAVPRASVLLIVRRDGTPFAATPQIAGRPADPGPDLVGDPGERHQRLAHLQPRRRPRRNPRHRGPCPGGSDQHPGPARIPRH